MRKQLALCLLAASVIAPTVSSAQDDPFFQGSYVEGQLGFGLVLPQLDGPLTVVNNVGAGPFAGLTPVHSTSILDFDAHAQAGLSFSLLTDETSRTILSMTGRNARDTTPLTSAIADAFPGIHDDGFVLPAGFVHPTTIETTELTLRAIREWQSGTNGLRWRMGLSAHDVSQDLASDVFAGVPTPGRTLATTSTNQGLSLVMGASHYRSLGRDLGLRLTGDVSAGYNRYRFNYQNVNRFGVLDQSVATQDSGLVLGSTLSARLEKSLGHGGVLSLEVGMNTMSGVGSGVETFLNPLGTNTLAVATKGTIATAHVSIGYAFKF